MMSLITAIFRIYEIIIVIRVVFSWINVDENQPVAQWVHRLTEPLLEPLRRLLPTERIGIDFSPLLLLLALEFAERMIAGLFNSF